MALDEPKEDDNKYEAGGVTYLVEKGLLDQVGALKVDFVEQGWRTGFMVSSEKPISTGSSTCGGSCSC